MIGSAEYNKKCAVCLEELDSLAGHDKVTLSCGHVFGRTCAAKWARIKPQCALCRRWLTARDRQALRPPGRTTIHERNIKLLKTFAAVAFCCSRFGGLYGAFKLVKILTKPLLVANAVNAFCQCRAIRRLSQLVIENSPPVIVSLLGISTRVAAQAMPRE